MSSNTPDTVATVRLELAPVDLKPDPWQRWIAIGNLVSVVVLAVGLFLTYQANQETSSANREQQRLTEQGQVTDRFAKAIEQLGQSGPEKIDVRLGAIYALERIMRDSAVDHPAVVSVLTAFIRVHAPANPAVKGTSRSSPPADIQAALRVLGGRNVTHDRDYLDLSGTDLGGANLSDANLSGANLNNTNLAGAGLPGANLSGAYLVGANLTGATLADPMLLAPVNLSHANLSDVDLTGTNLIGVVLAGAELSGAKLGGANLTGADLRGADLASADLHGVRWACAKTDGETRLPAGVARPRQEC